MPPDIVNANGTGISPAEPKFTHILLIRLRVPKEVPHCLDKVQIKHIKVCCVEGYDNIRHTDNGVLIWVNPVEPTTEYFVSYSCLIDYEIEKLKADAPM